MKQMKAYMYVNILFAFLFGSIATSAILTAYDKSKRPVKKRPLFMYGGAVDYTEWIEGFGVDPIEFAKPQPSLARLHSVDLSGKSAARIGIAVLASKCGRQFVNQQKPFMVSSIIDGKVWKVKGNPNNNDHVSSEIFIQKADAQILRIIRNSNKQ